MIYRGEDFGITVIFGFSGFSDNSCLDESSDTVSTETADDCDTTFSNTVSTALVVAVSKALSKETLSSESAKLSRAGGDDFFVS